MQNKWRTVLLTISGGIVLFLIGLVIFTGVKQNRNLSFNHQPIRVVSSLDSYGEMAQAVLGKQGEVKSVMTDPNVDPHDFEPTANTAKLYQNATVTISNGGGYDTWSERFTKANHQAHAINLADLYDYHDGDNEHYWYEPDVVTRLTNQLVQTYSRIEPSQRQYFEKNARAYQRKAQKIETLRAELKAELAGKGVLTTEPVFDHQLSGLGVKMLDPAFAQAIDDGNDPTPTAMSDWQKAVKQHQAVVVINNKQTSSRLVKQALNEAKQAGVPIVNVTETMPKDTTYIDWQYDQLKQLQKAVQS
ncbi:zinc/manganese transport system substrate-binding protein [Weissella uvarum]|uniref:metal ABC transporter solute-binding protein, Zn/Mn family n=1 Tax=Weissella uvarum TaxID=1479233 RepID=UPI001961D0C1|nr:zinc ABC transporter substrate-binding protein [Weissella uvarum]MBM7616865.1 zinc/manganese transport system substrate-binding protein [Weissella uvarum]MCM0594683.1 zinc ABC transporter substrate-binding protein [Weissella uvarum]